MSDHGSNASASKRTQRIAGLLQEAGETDHLVFHPVFRVTDGADEDWASWHADRLIGLSQLPQRLLERLAAQESR